MRVRARVRPAGDVRWRGWGARCWRHLSAGLDGATTARGATEAVSPRDSGGCRSVSPAAAGRDPCARDQDRERDPGRAAPGVCARAHPGAGPTEDAVMVFESLEGRCSYHCQRAAQTRTKQDENPRKMSRAWQAESGGLRLLREGTPELSGAGADGPGGPVQCGGVGSPKTL